jgi:hypothetical protein
MCQNPSYWDSTYHLAPSDRPREQNPRWLANSEYLLRIGERIGFKKCILLDTLDLNWFGLKSDAYSCATNSDMKDLLNKSKIGLFKFSK